MGVQPMMLPLFVITVLMVALIAGLGLLWSRLSRSDSKGKPNENLIEGSTDSSKKEQGALSAASLVQKITRMSAAELSTIKTPSYPTIPEKAYLLPADVMVGTAAERTASLLEPYPELQEYKQKLEKLAQDAAKPLLLVIMGQFKTGKSSFINQLLGMEDCLKVEVTPATAAVTMLSYGEQPEVVAHLLDRTEQRFPYESLHSLSAEGDAEGARLRSELDYLEVRLPVELLKKVTIVDTPGLNSDIQHHTKATEYFIDRADQVLWLFSYGHAATKMEILTLGRLRGAWKPVGVVNRIDEHDPEEGDLDAFLKQVRRRLGDHVCRLVGVSALQAAEAKAKDDAVLYAESRWSQLEQVLQEELYDKAAMKKGIRLLSRLRETMTELHEQVLAQHAQFSQADAFVRDQEKAMKEATEHRKKVAELLSIWSGFDPGSAFYRLKSSYPLPELIQGQDKLNQQLNMMIGVQEELSRERKLLDQAYEANQQAIEHHNKDHVQLEKEYAEYNKSGMFGGRPIFDFDGTGKRLDARAKLLDERANELNSEKEQLLSRHQLFLTRLERNEQEAYELSQLAVKHAQATLDELDKLLNHQEEAEAKAKATASQLYWTVAAKPKTETLVGGELAAIVTSLGRRVGLSYRDDTAASLSLSIARLQDLEQLLLSEPAEAYHGAAETAAAAEVGQFEAIQSGMNRIAKPDLPALVAALQPGEELVLEKGTYILTQTMVLDKPIRMRGAGQQATVIQGAVETLLKLNGNHKRYFEGISFDLCNTVGTIVQIESGEAHFQDCGFTGARTVEHPTDTEERGAALAWRDSSAGSIIDCHFHGNSAGCSMLSSSKVTVQSSRFWDHPYTALYAGDHTIIEVNNSEITHSGIGVYLDGQAKGYFKGNRLWCNEVGIVGSDEAELTIKENEFNHNEEDGIQGRGKAFITALGNSCSMNIRGISLLDSSSGYIAANVCTSNLSTGISYETKSSLIVERNICTWNGEAGICHQADGPTLLAWNECSRNMQHGMYFTGTGQHAAEENKCNHNHDGGMTVHDNIILTAKSNECSDNYFGIIIWKQVEATLEDNRCNNNRTGGIFCGGQSSVTALRNECNGNKTGIGLGNEARGTVSECMANNNELYGIGFGQQSSGRVVANACRHNGEGGIAVIEQSVADVYSNTCSDNKFAGILISSSGKCKAHQNRCMTNEQGIQVAFQSSPELDKNECYHNRGDGIAFMDEAAGSAVENDCYQNGLDGIYVTGLSKPRLERNISTKNGNSGIHADERAKPVIHYNVLKHNEGYGIQLSGDALPNIGKNTMQANEAGDISK
ncbi:right-handed parallel beta-helix repeat-containing protein [Paenibacillus silviterrae]|uniref:right-handed parallel beta-helix repeat-containing protein n=1 Tax=Paenibacillus silviterrae TaxID=3242194 RepID=UPI002542C062|nr:right-handed parallel beta-helix repeat-containing protein [Paenibacillus chinjuensis]